MEFERPKIGETVVVDAFTYEREMELIDHWPTPLTDKKFVAVDNDGDLHLLHVGSDVSGRRLAVISVLESEWVPPET